MCVCVFVCVGSVCLCLVGRVAQLVLLDAGVGGAARLDHARYVLIVLVVVHGGKVLIVESVQALAFVQIGVDLALAERKAAARPEIARHLDALLVVVVDRLVGVGVVVGEQLERLDDLELAGLEVEARVADVGLGRQAVLELDRRELDHVLAQPEELVDLGRVRPYAVRHAPLDVHVDAEAELLHRLLHPPRLADQRANLLDEVQLVRRLVGARLQHRLDDRVAVVGLHLVVGHVHLSRERREARLLAAQVAVVLRAEAFAPRSRDCILHMSAYDTSNKTTNETNNK